MPAPGLEALLPSVIGLAIATVLVVLGMVGLGNS